MSAATWLVSLLSARLVFISADQTISAEHGQTVTLPCHLTSRDPVLVVEWSRTDLGSDYVLLYRDEQIDPFNQHPSYQNRVRLEDQENGDVSLVLEDGTADDSGTYECRVAQTGKNRRKQLISSVHLVVAPPPQAHFEKLTGDQKTRTGSEEEGGSQEVLTSDPTAGSEAEVTKYGGSHVGEAQRVEALKVQFVQQIQDGEKKNRSRTFPGLIVSLSCFSLVAVAFISLNLWKKKRPETQHAEI